MSLHARLLLAYGYLVTLVLVGAAGAALGFHSLGHNIGRVLDENFVGVRASMDMLEALERQDSAVLTALLNHTDVRGKISESEASFLAALDRASTSGAVEDQEHVLESIRKSFDAYRTVRDEVVRSRSLERYETECFPAFEPVKAGVRRLLDLNHQAMVQADREAQHEATVQAAWHAALAALALLSMGLLSRTLRRSIIERLEALRGVADAVARGDLTRRAAIDPQDELGRVARQLNELLDAQQELSGAMEARLSRLRQLIVGLLETEAPSAALVTLSGRIVASDLGEDVTARVEAAAATLGALPEAGAEVSGPLTRDIPSEGGVIRFRLLLAAGKRPVGWLARPGAGSDAPGA